MKRVPVAAAFLLLAVGFFFQARGNGSELSRDSTSPSSLTKSGDEISLRPFAATEPDGSSPPVSPLVSQLARVHPTKGTHLKHHRVLLSWQPGQVIMAIGEIISYNVYRCGGVSTKCTKLNAEPVETPEYVDDRVQGGRVYFYATTAVNQEGKQSRPSNLVRVAIPFP